MLNGKSILITGGTGSLGKMLVKTILAKYKPEKLIVFSRDELKQFEMAQTWSTEKYPCMRYFLGDVREQDRLKRAFSGVDYVIHAAALKQIPAAEYNPYECIKTNIMGAVNVTEAAIENNVKRVIALSTDKAVNPINLYGATKLCSDKLFVAAHVYAGLHETKFAVVRYGNVLGSRGSVIPFFKEKAKTGILPITDARMTRFWITIGRAVEFVLGSLEKMQGGEIFVPRIPSMKITDLAKAVAPNCKHENVGIRPGEKIHETLISEDEARNIVQFRDCFVVQTDLEARTKLIKHGGKLCDDHFRYDSGNNTEWLSVEQLQKFAQKSGEDESVEKEPWYMEDLP